MPDTFTEEEMEAVREVNRRRTEDILRKNSAQAVCISCLEDIMGDQPIVSTIHGAYHGRPWKCLDGRD